MSNSVREVISCVAVALLTTLLHVSVLDGHWRWDDPQILLHVIDYPLLADFIDPAVWQQFSPANLTPWLLASFNLDLLLFGMTPAGFYAHQLLALAAASVALYLCLRLWLQRVPSLAAALLFPLGPPVAIVLEQLMTRHYVEGLLFCLLSLWCFVRRLRADSDAEAGKARLWLLFSVLLYALALTAKEIYAPLVVLLPFLPESQWRRRIRAVLPHIGVIVAYTFWRGYMLQSVSGGYAAPATWLDTQLIGDVANTFASFPRLLFGSPGIPLFLAYAVALLWVMSRRGWFLWGLLAALVLLPLVPLVRNPGIMSPDRYLFLVWVVFTFSVGVLTARLAQRQDHLSRALACLLIPLFAVAAAFHSTYVMPPVWQIAEEFDTQSRFMMSHDDSVAFLPSQHVLPSFWFATGLRDIRAQAGESTPVAVVDPLFLQQGDRGQQGQQEQQVYAWSPECRCMEDVTASAKVLRMEAEARVDPSAPLQMEHRYADGIFSWKFGPYEAGRYDVVSSEIGVIPAPAREGSLRVTLPDAPFYLRYTAPEGWMTYSSEQQIQHNAPVTVWQRPRR